MLIYTLLYILEILICAIQLLELQGRCLINLLLSLRDNTNTVLSICRLYGIFIGLKSACQRMQVYNCRYFSVPPLEIKN